MQKRWNTEATLRQCAEEIIRRLDAVGEGELTGRDLRDLYHGLGEVTMMIAADIAVRRQKRRREAGSCTA